MSEINYIELDFWWKVAITLLSLSYGIYLFWERHSDNTEHRLEAIATDVGAQLGDHSNRLARAETKLEANPSHDDLGDLHARITVVSNGVSTISGELVGIKTTLNLVHRHLLNEGNK